MLSFVGRGMCTSVSADQRSEALGARNAGGCRLAQDGLEKDDAVFGVEDCYGDQGEDEESGERAAEHFEEPGPLVERGFHYILQTERDILVADEPSPDSSRGPEAIAM